MDNNQVILSGLTPMQLIELFRPMIQQEVNRSGTVAGINEKPVSTKEICDFLSITEPTLIRWRNKGKIPFLKIGTNIRYDKAAVLKAIEAPKK
jgi:excisionase family DNA binding protein